MACGPLNRLGTTNTYLNHLKPADVIEAMKDRAGWSEKPERSDTPINPEKLTELTNEQLAVWLDVTCLDLDGVDRPAPF